VFRDAYPKRDTKPIRAGLSDLADALGDVRDLDVRLAEIDRWGSAQDADVRSAIQPLRDDFAARRVAAAARLARRLDSRGHRRLRLRLIEVKRLRYTIEFLGDVLGPGKGPLIEKLVALQDHLGALNDASLAVEAIRGLLGDRHPSLSAEQEAAVVAYLGDRERERDRLWRSVGQAWRPVAGVAFARELARAILNETRRAAANEASS
jgi:CHAD domain-containing protein